MNEKLLEYFKSDDIHLIQCEHKWCDAYGYEKSQMKKDLLDYITNLQQLYENALKINQNENKYRTELEDKYVVLQQENERLKEENKSYQEYPFIIIEKNGVICRKNQEINMIKSRCEKAIEELTYMSTDAYTDNYDIRDKHYNLLMNILNGSDENE